MRVVSFFNSKGGSGASTLKELISVNIIAIYKLKCTIIDTSFPNFSIENDRKRDEKEIDNKVYEKIIDQYGKVQVIKENDKDKVVDILEKEKGMKTDIVFIDMQSTINEHTLFYLGLCNYIFIPTSLALKEQRPSIKVYALLKENMLKLSNGNIKNIFLVLNKIEHSDDMEYAIEEFVSKAQQHGIDVIDYPIFKLPNYGNASTILPLIKKPSFEDTVFKAFLYEFYEIVINDKNYIEEYE